MDTVNPPRPAWLSDPEVYLMLRVGGGDTAAFAELVRRYWLRVFGRLRQWLGDRAEAEDLTQDVFLRVYRYRDRYQARAKFATWLFHITRNVARNALRSRRRPCLRLEALAGSADQPGGEWLVDDGGEPPSRPLERAELADKVRSAVSGLTDRQRAAMELHEFEDRTYSEVAGALAMSPQAVKSLLHRARKRLRARLAPFMGGRETTQAPVGSLSEGRESPKRLGGRPKKVEVPAKPPGRQNGM
jgi:RNA polymerase sigma-70 factor (ECF subfamily)